MNLSRLVPWILLQGLCIFTYTSGKKILVFHHVASYSHRVATWPLAEALAKRGHEVTYISPYYPKKANPNITEIVPVKLAEFTDEFLNHEFDINIRIRDEMDSLFDVSFKFGINGCETLYSSPEFKDFVKLNKKFDLVIVDNCFAECGVALAYKLSAKWILFSTIITIPYEYDIFGYSPESSAIPELDSKPFKVPMGFLSRVSNALTSLRWRLGHHEYSIYIDKFLRNELNVPNMPYVGDLVNQANLIFYTGDVITDYPRALPPNFVNVAGIHCVESKNALPESLEKFITSNGTDQQDSDGFVYISLGSVVVSSNLPDRIKQIFFDAIKSFPKLKFLWKWNGDFPKEIPENLRLQKWFPQIDVLGHPKIRAFVTQNGRPSSLEGLFHGVPLISFPILGDQDYNANRLAQMGAAIQLEIRTVTLEELKDAIWKSVYDPKTKARVTQLQTLFRDRPMSPVDTAVWWTEYILRTDDTSHLLPAGHDQYWYVRRQIDVWAFLSIGLFIIFIGSLLAIVKVLRVFVQSEVKIKTA